jgi:hypothetical protein
MTGRHAVIRYGRRMFIRAGELQRCNDAADKQ